MLYESFYNAMPVWGQNILCSAYGLKLYHERYSSPWKNYFESLMRTEYYTKEDLSRIQRQKLLNIVKLSLRNTEYYSSCLKNLDIERSCGTDEVLKELPILEKETVRVNPDAFISKKFNRKRLLKINTSGTTGTPMSIYMTPEARKANYAFFARSKKWAGLNSFSKSITLAGRLIVPQKQKKPPFWRRNYCLNNTLFSSYHIDESSIPMYIEEMASINPEYIDSYPSSIYPIAKYLLGTNHRGIRPLAIITSSETLLNNQREVIEKAFGCRVYDQYGSAEQVVFACQCEFGSYHINPEYGILEVVDKNNNSLKTGELGEFVCTGFTNEAMPLIRYKIGDMGIVSNRHCKCGRNFPILEMITGRVDDVLITPEGKYVGRLDPIFKGMSNTIKETQIIQQKYDLIEINIVKGEGYKERDAKSLISELKKRVGQNVTVKLNYATKIEKTKSGKFRSVINNIDN